MSIYQLTQKVKTAGQTRTHEQRIKLLKDAYIIDSKGHLDKRFFSTSRSKDDRAAPVQT